LEITLDVLGMIDGTSKGGIKAATEFLATSLKA